MTVRQEYCTLIRGQLVQQSGLCVGGGPVDFNAADVCCRNGKGELTIPGTALAGALIETAARLFPAMVDEDDANEHARLLQRNITSKKRGAPQKRATQEEEKKLRLSVWQFFHAHPTQEIHTQWRQGVGIRQATGASAAEKKALYDFEFVPAATKWSFTLEVDTFRGGLEAEALALLALDEWTRGRAWLGRAAARGTGWATLEIESLKLLRLNREQHLDLWPDSTLTLDQQFQQVEKLVPSTEWSAAVEQANAIAENYEWQRGKWHYLTIPVEIAAGESENGYGWDVLQVGGHPAGELENNQSAPITPLSVDGANKDWIGDEYKQPDAPFVSTTAAGETEDKPYLPGGGLRGPLRHTASRLLRGAGRNIRDPNRKNDPLANELTDRIREERANGNAELLDEDIRRLIAGLRENEPGDTVTLLFGAEELGGRLLVRDAITLNDEFQLARVDHHAEDEFTAGVYGTGKFDRNVLLKGKLGFEMVIEAPNQEELKSLAETIAGALQMAQLGQMPIGGGKWRGAGWLKWQISNMRLWQAGAQKCLRESGNEYAVAAVRQLFETNSKENPS